MCRGCGGAVTGSTYPRPQSSSKPAAETLQESGDGARRVDLNDPVEVADIDTQFQGRGGDDHAAPGFGEGLLGAAAFVGRQRSLRQERRHSPRPQCLAEFLDQLPRMAEGESFLTAARCHLPCCRPSPHN
jgi:hypothetical protein